MATGATPLMTADEFYAFSHLPENEDRILELQRGEVVEMSRPGKRHGLVCGNVSRILGNYAMARKKGYVCSNDTGMLVDRDPDTVRGPDFAFFEDTQSFDQVEEKYGEQPPLLAVEVLSPNDSMGKVNRLVREQLLFGVQMVWVLDPEVLNVTVYRLGKDYYVLEEPDEITGEEVLTEFRCRVAEFFRLPGQ